MEEIFHPLDLQKDDSLLTGLLLHFQTQVYPRERG
jgi:hypothetical protein